MTYLNVFCSCVIAGGRDGKAGTVTGFVLQYSE